jgi:hypothetical protein
MDACSKIRATPNLPAWNGPHLRIHSQLLSASSVWVSRARRWRRAGLAAALAARPRPVRRCAGAAGRSARRSVSVRAPRGSPAPRAPRLAQAPAPSVPSYAWGERATSLARDAVTRDAVSARAAGARAKRKRPRVPTAQLGGGAGALAPYATLNPSVSPSGLDGVETWTFFWTMTPPSLAVSFGLAPLTVPGSNVAWP